MTDISKDEKAEVTPPLEVKVVDKEKPKATIYDSYEDYEYDEHDITEDEIKEFKDGNSRT